MGKFKFLKVAEYDAVGGPEKATMGADGHMKTPTRNGRFVVAFIEKHISYGKYAFYSGVAWGTPLRQYNGKAQIKKNGQWVNLSSVFGKYTDIKILDVLKQAYKDYKSAIPTLKQSIDLPTSWIFNDFGHISIKYFKDGNGNYKLDGKESIIGDFIHTTPVDELNSSLGLSVTLGESHGCIHVKPKNIDDILNIYIKKGSVIVVKSYSETYAPISFESPVGRPNYEAHFYSGLKKIIIYKVTSI